MEVRSNRAFFTEAVFDEIIETLSQKLERYRNSLIEKGHTTGDEIRLVTVLFVDVMDSTILLQRLGASDWKMLLAQLHEQIATIVRRWGGQIGQYLGDGILCFFGAQDSHDDDAHHAVSCALEIQQSLQVQVPRKQNSEDNVLGLRIGVSTGRLVVGLVGDERRQERLALGAATNLAARLQFVAGRGEVVIDSTTFSQVRREFITQAFPPLHIKGFEEPIAVYRILMKRKAEANRFVNTWIHKIEIPLIGRDSELNHLHEMSLRAAQNHQFHVVNVLGDVGIGKSHFLQEFIHTTKNLFVPINLSVRYETRNKSYNLLDTFVVTLCSVSEEMSGEQVQAQIEAYLGVFWDHPDVSYVAQAIGYTTGYLPQAPPGNLHDWLKVWFLGLAKKHSPLILIDNLHWADEQSILLVQELALTLQDHAGMLVCTTRPGYPSAEPGYFVGHPHHSTIVLKRLHTQHIQTIIAYVSQHVVDLPQIMSQHIVDIAEGNPLFSHEILNMLFDTHIFRPVNEQTWAFDLTRLDEALASFPDSLIAILQAQLDELSPETRLTLQVAAVAGDEFWEGVLAFITKIEDIQNQLQLLIARELIEEQPAWGLSGERAFHFRHSIYPEVAYEMIPRQQRENYHNQVADWLLTRTIGHPRYYPVLANQFQLGGRFGLALFTYLEAAIAYLEMRKPHEALRFIDKGLAIARRTPRTEALYSVARLWALRAQILFYENRFEDGNAASKTALMVLSELPRVQFVDTRVNSERILGLTHMSRGRFSEASEALSRAHILIDPHDFTRLAEVTYSLGVLNFYQGKIDQSRKDQQKALEGARQAQEKPLIAQIMSQLAALDVERGLPGVALDRFEESIRLHQEARNPIAEAYDLRYVGGTYLSLGLPQMARDYFLRAIALHEECGRRDALSEAYLGLSLLLSKQVAQGKALLEQAIDYGTPDMLIQSYLQIAYIYGLTLLDDYVQCREHAITFTEQVRQKNPLLFARGLRWMGVSMYRLGDLNAYDTLMEALRGEETYGGRDLWMNYYLVYRVVEDDELKRKYITTSARILQKHLDTLHNRPHILKETRANPLVQRIFGLAQIRS